MYLEDGTEIDDQDSFEAACQSSDSPIFVLVPVGEKYNMKIACKYNWILEEFTEPSLFLVFVVW